MKRALFFIAVIILCPLGALAKNLTIEVRGLVISPPGEFGTQFFYLANGRDLWQIYSYRKTFPPLKKGDVVAVRGEKTSTRNLPRLKIKTVGQIKIAGRQPVPAASTISFPQLKENCGKLVLLEGKIIKDESGQYFLISSSKKILLLSPKSSGNLGVLPASGQITGVPFLAGQQLALLVLSLGTNEPSGTKSIVDSPAPDLTRPNDAFLWTKIGLFCALIAGFILFIRRWRAKRPKF